MDALASPADAVVRATCEVTDARISATELAVVADLLEGGDANLEQLLFWFRVHFGPRT